MHGILVISMYITVSDTENGSAMDGIAIGVLRAVVGTTAVFFIAIVVVASICIYVCVQSSKRKCMFKFCCSPTVFKISNTPLGHKPIHTHENTR